MCWGARDPGADGAEGVWVVVWVCGLNEFYILNLFCALRLPLSCSFALRFVGDAGFFAFFLGRVGKKAVDM